MLACWYASCFLEVLTLAVEPPMERKTFLPASWHADIQLAMVGQRGMLLPACT